MSMFKKFKRKSISELMSVTTFVEINKTLDFVSVSTEDKKLSPEEFNKGYVARNPSNHNDLWYVSKAYADENLEALEEVTITADTVSEKTLTNTSVEDVKKNVSDVVVWGDGDTFQLICKASSKSQGWMKSCKAMEIPNIGCVVQVTTQQDKNVAEALVFVPNVKIVTMMSHIGEDATVIGRKIVHVSSNL